MGKPLNKAATPIRAFLEYSQLGGLYVQIYQVEKRFPLLKSGQFHRGACLRREIDSEREPLRGCHGLPSKMKSAGYSGTSRGCDSGVLRRIYLGVCSLFCQ